jgi:dipeptidyl aminopeptidase/acylaminoacyl peptidase
VTATTSSSQPPLLDRELFFGDPEIVGAEISPDGRYIAFLKPLDGVRNVWVKRAEEPFDCARPITRDTKRPIPGFAWSRDAKYVLYVQDQAGDENYNAFAVDPSENEPAARNLTDVKGVRAMIYAVPKAEPDLMYVGLNDRDKAWHDLYRVRISTGERTLIRTNTERIASWNFDNAAQLRLAVRSAENGDTEILRVDETGFTKIYSCDVFEECSFAHFHKDGRRAYFISNKGEGDLTRLALMDAETGGEELVETDPEGRVDISGAIFSEPTDELIGTSYDDDKPRRYWRDKSIEADFELIRSKLPDREIDRASHTRDERIWLVSAWSDVEPGETWLFNCDTKELIFQYRVRERLPREPLAAMQAIRYASSDGLEIPAYLTLPKGVEPANLPLVVVPHGGPWVRDEWSYDTIAQFLANRGYAVLQPNYRGSTGYGKRFLDASNGEWGRRMQDDLTWGVKHLIARGIANPARVGIFGGSYGGYAVLAGVAFTPDLYAAGVSIVGPSNLLTLLESIPAYWEAGRVMMYRRMADPRTPEGRELLERESPLFSADRIRTPLMVVQGANDPRVNKAESEQIVVALRDRGFPVEYILADDEGHGFARPVNNMALMMAAERFLAKHLGGRYQEGGTPEVVARLHELIVDPATVVMAPKVDAASVGVPAVAATLQPGTHHFKSVIAVADQQLNLAIAIEVRDDGTGYVVTESIDSPMVQSTDTATLDKKSLVVLRRSLTEGDTVIDVDFADGTKAGGLVFADGPGSWFVIACLPLAEGYSTIYRTYDLQQQKVKLMRLQVTGPDAGALKVELSPADGSAGQSSLWIDTARRRPLRVQSVLPELGGAIMTSELVE